MILSHPTFLVYVAQIMAIGNVLEFSHYARSFGKFWKSLYSYKHIFSFGENTSHTLSTQRLIWFILSLVQGGRVNKKGYQ